MKTNHSSSSSCGRHVHMCLVLICMVALTTAAVASSSTAQSRWVVTYASENKQQVLSHLSAHWKVVLARDTYAAVVPRRHTVNGNANADEAAEAINSLSAIQGVQRVERDPLRWSIKAIRKYAQVDDGGSEQQSMQALRSVQSSSCTKRVGGCCGVTHRS